MADVMEMLAGALSEYLKSESSEDVQKLKTELMQKMIEETAVKPTRIPAPLNITEIGGYYNLMQQTIQDAEEFQQKRIEMQLSMIASALGLPT